MLMLIQRGPKKQNLSLSFPLLINVKMIFDLFHSIGNLRGFESQKTLSQTIIKIITII
jgi:hypothetical protein